MKRLFLLAAAAVAAATWAVERAFAVSPSITTLAQKNRHAWMTFSAPRAEQVSVRFATQPDRATDGNFFSENVVDFDLMTRDEVERGAWLDEDQLDPGRYFVMLYASAETSCYSEPPPTYDLVVDPACANGFSDIAILNVAKPAQRFSVKAVRDRSIHVLYLTLKVTPLGEDLPYKVCWRRRSGARACVRSTVSGYDWNAPATDEVRIGSRNMRPRTTFTWFVGTRAVASKVVRVGRS